MSEAHIITLGGEARGQEEARSLRRAAPSCDGQDGSNGNNYQLHPLCIKGTLWPQTSPPEWIIVYVCLAHIDMANDLYV